MGMKMPALAKTYSSVIQDLSLEFGKMTLESPEPILWTRIVVRLMRHKHLTGNGLAPIWGCVNRGDLEETIIAIGEYNDRQRENGRPVI